MYENFNFYKAEKFLLETKQIPYIIQAVNGLLQYNEIEVLDIIEHKRICNYYMIEKLYCLIMQEKDYNVPFTLHELIECTLHYPSKSYKSYNEYAYNYLTALHKRLSILYRN